MGKRAKNRLKRSPSLRFDFTVQIARNPINRTNHIAGIRYNAFDNPNMRYTDGALTSSHHLFDGNAVTRFHLFGKFNLRTISMTKHPHTIFNKSRCLVVYTAPRCANDPVLRFSFCSHFICLIAFRLRLPHRLAGSGIRWRGNVPQIPRGGYFPQIIPRNRRFFSQRLLATAFIVRASGRPPHPRCRELWRKLRKTSKKSRFL